jgi:hypothetical protein
MKNKVVDLYDACGCLLGTLILILIVALALAIVFGVFCFEGWIFMLLWNWLAVELFGANILGYWVCVGIVFALNFVGRLVFGRSSTSRND